MVSINLKEKIREVPDFPKKGILFYDITTLLQDPQALKESIDKMYDLVADKKFDKVAAIESRGFIFGVPLALKMGCGFSVIRKPGKLPYKKIAKSYDLEYGSNTIEMHEDAVKEGDRVLLVDDLLATGGTMTAAASLIEEAGAEVETILFMIELSFLKGRKMLDRYDIKSLLIYDS